MHEHTRNTRGMLNEVSSAQISSVVLVILMILSVTQLSLIATSLYTLQPKTLCVSVCQSVSVHEH